VASSAPPIPVRPAEGNEARSERPAIPASARATAQAGPVTRSYKVQARGERLYDIAGRTLGDSNRWSEIYRLNPQVAPEMPVPGGTWLHLPADARVEQ
jgi:nucleoid-associated protein YgaU